jgi:hypothetical protein
MPSTYSPSLRIELIGTGDQSGSWGTTTNTNLGTLIEDGISGYVAVSVTAANQALTANNGAADQARNAVLALTTTTGANFAVYAPPSEKTYTVHNASAYTATIYNSTVLGNTTAAGAGVLIPAGKTVTVWTNGTAFAFQNNYLVGNVVGNATGVSATTWTVSESAGVLYFAASGVNKAKLDASGNLTVVGNVTAYGSI